MWWTQDGIYPFPLIDNGDIQWRDFRDSLPILLPAAVVTEPRPIHMLRCSVR